MMLSKLLIRPAVRYSRALLRLMSTDKVMETRVKGIANNAAETPLMEEMDALERTLKAEMGAVRRAITGKLDSMENDVWRLTYAIVLAALLAPDIRDAWKASKRSE